MILDKPNTTIIGGNVRVDTEEETSESGLRLSIVDPEFPEQSQLGRPYFDFLTSLTEALEPELLTEKFLSGLAGLFSLQAVSLDKIAEQSDDQLFDHVSGIDSSCATTDYPVSEYLGRAGIESSDAIALLLAGQAVHSTDKNESISLFPCNNHLKETVVLSIVNANGDAQDFQFVPDLLRIYINLFRSLDLGQRDKLTGLLNRQTFDSKLSRMLEAQRLMAERDRKKYPERRSQAADCSAWLAMIDIDHFKRINDQYGHVYGDEVILTIGQHIRSCFRKSDLLFRFGGEEFVVVLEPIPAENVSHALERLRSLVARQELQHVGKVTISIGFAEFTENGFAPKIIDCADQALYYAKEHGRNQVANYETLIARGELDEENKIDGGIDLF